MKKTELITLQTKGISVEIKNKADKQAQKDGFTSVQDIVRLFVKLYASEGFPLNISWGAAHDPGVKKSLKEYREGAFKTLQRNQKLSEITD